MSRPDLPALFPNAAWAQALKPNLLPMNYKSSIQTFNKRKGQLGQTLCYSTFFAREVRMALVFSALVGQLEMPRPLLHKRLMHQPGSAEAFESAVNRDFVRDSRCKAGGNLFLGQRFMGLQQNA